jgi:hypothetical protein
MQMDNQTSPMGGGGNKVFDRGATSGRGGSYEIFSFFEDFGFLGFRRLFMIIVDAINDSLEREDVVDRIFRQILCIN